MRPRLFYVVWHDGAAMFIAHGLRAARELGDSYKSFRTEQQAEEFAMWWNHEHPRWFERT